MTNFITGAEVKEFDFIKRITGRKTITRNDIIKGIGDDAAIVKGKPGRCYLFTCDAQVEGKHFLKGREPYSLGCRLAAVNLSDIAAMGGTPLFALSSLFIPSSYYDGDFMERVYDGLYETLARWNAVVVGGNVSSSNDSLAMDLFLVGDVEEELVLKRSGARTGQLLCVSGNVGDSGAGLKLLLNDSIAKKVKDKNETFFDLLLKRHLEPQPEIEMGRLLAKSRAVGACIDISDGLIQDAGHLGESSDVFLNIYIDKIPLSDEFINVADCFGEDYMHIPLTAGEDYKLLFTIDRERFADIEKAASDLPGCKITVIGEVVSIKNGGEQKNRVAIYNSSGNQVELNSGGFDHFESIK
ncbi:MAG: thiamine-phosphate kinase [Deltaproteobacteria bacterium]|nr:thiamine-phosphate kinase [Deltaproteobacteria bacterium]